jgi:iron-sulfur cluster assembly accessory protein
VPIDITPAAERFIRRMIRFAAVPGAGFRLALGPGGCFGLAAEFDVLLEPLPGDTVIEHNGLPLFMPAQTRLLLEGVTVDCADTPTASGFVFRNAKGAEPSCGTAPDLGAGPVLLSSPAGREGATNEHRAG